MTTANGFAQKALITLLSVIAFALVSFCAWLALAVIDIRENIVRIDTNVSSLLETRKDEKEADKLQTDRRVEKLERAE